MASTASPLTAENLAKRDGSGYKPGQIILLDIPAPANIIACLPDPTNPNRRESAVIRFSTVSCRPREFVSKGHALRPSLFARPRRIRLLVTVLISSDDSETDVRNTLHAILSSVEAIDAACDLGEPVSWKQIVVLLIGCTKSDGMLAESENLLRRLGLFTPPEPAPREMGWGGQVYEYTPLLELSAADEEPSVSPLPCQMIFFNSSVRLATDEANSWAVRAFADALGAEAWIPLAPVLTPADLAPVMRRAVATASADNFDPSDQEDGEAREERVRQVLQEAASSRNEVREYRLPVDPLREYVRDGVLRS